MQKMFALLVLCWISVPAFAVTPWTYDLDLEFKMHDEVKKNHLVVQQGKPKTLTDQFAKEKIFCEVAVNEKSTEGKPTMFIRFAVGNVGPDGKRFLVARSEVFAMDKTTSSASIIGNNGEVALVITVTPTRRLR